MYQFLLFFFFEGDIPSNAQGLILIALIEYTCSAQWSHMEEFWGCQGLNLGQLYAGQVTYAMALPAITFYFSVIFITYHQYCLNSKILQNQFD